MIVGTAGHIDHGKTSLVRALTGTDTDRLPEEKRRGISIELGFAFLDTPSGDRIAFIDVPGHEALVHTMVAGACGIDFALLLVAADDGPMPQTREHLAVLSLLGIRQGAVVVTKCDRVDGARREALLPEIRAMLAPTPLSEAPIVEVSSHDGMGIDALRALLFEQYASSDPSADTEALDDEPERSFRLAIDRAFELPGTGTVVTGSVFSGTSKVGDPLALTPTLPRRRSTAPSSGLRARSIHAQNRAVESARQGERCAMAIHGLARDQVERGQWLCAPDIAIETQRVDARIRYWHAEADALRSGTRVEVHVGASRTQASLSVLAAEEDRDQIRPGDESFVQLVLHGPIAAWRGDRLLLRDVGGRRTLSGGIVLDPDAPARHRRSTVRLAQLDALMRPTLLDRLVGIARTTPEGVALDAFARAEAVGQQIVGEQLRAAAAEGGPLAGSLSIPGWLLGPRAVDTLRTAALGALRAFHREQPDELGPDRMRLRRLAAPRLPQSLWLALLKAMIDEGSVRQHGAVLHLPEHSTQLSQTETRIAAKVAPSLLKAGREGAWARDLARDSGESEALVRTTLARLARRGELHQVVKDLYFPVTTMRELAGLARDVGGAHAGEVSAAAFRDASGLGRKRAIQLLEYFDRIGLTRRIGDVHRVRDECTLFQR